MRPFLFLTFIVLCMFSCKKEAAVSPGLFGKWELRKVEGGFAGFDSTYRAGNGNVYIFNSDSTYTQYFNGKFGNKGTFTITQNNNPSTQPSRTIFFDHNTSGELFDMDGLELTIGADYNDGMALTYVKIHN